MRNLLVIFVFFVLTSTQLSWAQNIEKTLNDIRNINDKLQANTLVSNTILSLELPIVKDNQITFLYFQARGKSPEEVEIILYLDNKLVTNTMERVGVSDLFVFKTNFGNSDFVDYTFRVKFSDISKRFFNDPQNRKVSFRGNLIMSKVTSNSYSGSYILTYDIEPQTKISRIEKRKLWIYLPPGYDTSKSFYPVLYMHDGQNLWDGEVLPFGGWKVNTILDTLIRSNKVEPVIVVGIANSGERPKEYVGFSTLYGLQTNEDGIKLIEENSKKSLAYMDFVVNEVMPFVEKNFRVKKGRENTGIAGASFGAGVSLHIAFNNPSKFGLIGSLSGGHYSTNSQQFREKPYKVFDYIIDKELPEKPNFKIFLSCGTTDIDAIFLVETRKMYEKLKEKEWVDGKNLYYLISTNKGHNERTWAEQLPEMLIFFFGK
ncbi:MAG: esterase family protein [Brevinematales bacterium]|nr:esterase family protein [Brevinematales bacterium]